MAGYLRDRGLQGLDGDEAGAAGRQGQGHLSDLASGRPQRRRRGHGQRRHATLRGGDPHGRSIDGRSRRDGRFPHPGLQNRYHLGYRRPPERPAPPAMTTRAPLARAWRVLGWTAAALLLGPPPAFPQAAAPPGVSVSITGFIDSVTSWSRNMSRTDGNLMATGDREWYSRNRGRFDIIGQIDRAKAVLGIEIDSVWGTTALTGVDNNLAPGGGAQHFGATSAFDLNTDTQGSLEVKWLYTEFPLPLLPVPTIVRLGAQPFEVMYKTGVYASGDFAGVHVTSALARNVALNLTYVQVEEDLTGRRRNLGFGRGDDFAVIGSVAVTPVRGLDVRPMYSYFFADGTTSFSARQQRGGLGNRDSFPPDNTNPPGFKEHRHTIGVDARWSSGPFFLDP